MKRGVDHLDQPPAKRMKTTPVVFFWELPASATREKITALCHPYGDIVEFILIESKRQALVQMDSIPAAQALIDSYAENAPYIDGKPIKVTFSRKEEIKAQKPQYERETHYRDGGGAWRDKCHVVHVMCEGINQGTHQEDLVLLIAESHLDPSEYTPTKTLILRSKQMAFIEFQTVSGAELVCQTLQDRHVYLNDHPVKFSQCKHRDFIDGGEEVPSDMGERRHERPPERRQERMHDRRSDRDRYSEPRGGGYRLPPRSSRPPTPDYGRIPRDVIDDARSIGIPLDAIVMAPAVKTQEGLILFDEYYEKELRARERAAMDDRRRPRYADDYRDYSPPPFDRGGRVVMITGLCPEIQDCDKLQAMCGAFGDVRRTKLSFKNRDMGFVEMEDEGGAERVVRYLDGIQLWETQLEVKISKMNQLQGKPNVANENNEILTKDYANSDRNRYAGKARLKRNINAPGDILHISNLSHAALKDLGKDVVAGELSDLFGNKEVMFLKKNEAQLFCFAGSREEAVRIMVEHHLEDFHGRPLRISFSGRKNMPKRE